MEIVPADTAELLEAARELTRAYARLPHVEGRWENAEAEVEGLPGVYEPPDGGLLVATDGLDVLGSVAFHRLDGEALELKRLYVDPAARGRGIGMRLVQAVIQHARLMCCRFVRLDTAPELTDAIALYERLGFSAVPWYRDDLYEDARCFELSLG